MYRKGRKVVVGALVALSVFALAALGVRSGVSTDRGGSISVITTYVDCLEDAGVEGVQVQPVMSGDGALVWMKTGIDVPADVHGPCYRAVGGTGVSLQTSSWGN